MPRWTSAIGAALRAVQTSRRARLGDTAFWAAHSGTVQRDQLRRLLRAAAHTEVGRQRGFARLAACPDAELIPAFRTATPTVEYENIRAVMARMREGAEPDVSWPGVVRDWAQTSGTTGGQKYIPVSREMMRSNNKAALDIFAHTARMGTPLGRVFGGRVVFLGGSTNVTVSDRGVRTGDLSALVTPLIRWPLSEVYSPGPDIALMDHWPSKIDAIVERTVDQDVRGISGMASWSLVLMEKVLAKARSRDARVRCLRDVWPNLTLFIHGGVRYAPFDRRVREAWSGTPEGDIPHRFEVYPASEGFIAMQDTAGDPGLRLSSDIGIFFEFIPATEIGSPTARAFAADEVEPGVRYVVCMTTCAGLWRYIIGDVVEFDTVPRAGLGDRTGPARLRIVGRHTHFVNAFGENLIVEEIERAVVAAAERTGITLGEFTAAPVYPDAGRRAGLELILEWSDPRSTDAFAAAFDAALRSINVDYDTKRTGDLGMAPATVTGVPVGAFHAWMASRGRLGGQNKCPRCANHREYADGLLTLALADAPGARGPG
jgi:phenylacetate-coenzyme A ligase PaaK-like adenylate-forming protein